LSILSWSVIEVGWFFGHGNYASIFPSKWWRNDQD
tara:strand:- start:46810 stop:46914 length:105 start_codon:yes stop_codon:yes gene_type:complete